MRRLFWWAVCGVALALGSGPAFAAGSITGVSANPASPIAGESVDITVEGAGTCDLTVLYGDGQSVTLNNALMPRTIAHVYQSHGTFTASASAPDCVTSGPQEVRIVVRLRLEPAEDRDLANQIQLHPRILRTLGWGIEPGFGLILGGAEFGEQKGHIWILGENDTFKELEIEHWFDDAAGGLVPADIHDICVTGIMVESAEGLRSGVFPISVPIAVKALPREDVAVLSCGDDGDLNYCNGESTATEDIFSCWESWHLAFGSTVELNESIYEGQAGDPNAVPLSLVGDHRNCWAALADDSDTDRYRISLRNGWVLDSAQFASAVFGGDQDQGSTTPPSGTLPAGFVEGASSWEPEIAWEVSPNDEIAYGMTIFIRGPACASHK